MALKEYTDTGKVHGPSEYLSYNGHPRASLRMEQRATDMRDIGTLRMLARDADSVGATNVADHCRELARLFAYGAATDAYVALDSPTWHYMDVPHGPAVGIAYHVPTDMYVDVLHVKRHLATFRHPYYGLDRCSVAFLEEDGTCEGFGFSRYLLNRKGR